MADPAADRPDISIIVPTRNRSRLLRRLLDQLVALEPGPTAEILVIDEASSDDTPATLAAYADRGVRSIRHDDPVGLPAARNVGIAATTGTYVAWIDDDDLTAPDRLRRQHAALVDGGGRWSCAGRIDVDDRLRVLGHVRCPPGTGTLPGLLRWNSIPAAAQGLLVERTLLDEAGPFDESLRSAEDWEMCIRLAERSDPHLLDEPLVGYRTGVGSMSSDTTRMTTAMEAVVAKHGDLYRRHDVEPDWAALNHSLLAADLAASRRRAVRRAATLVRLQPSPGAVARVVLIAVAPAWFGRRSARARRAQVPASWERAARRWLDDVDPIGDDVTPG